MFAIPALLLIPLAAARAGCQLSQSHTIGYADSGHLNRAAEYPFRALGSCQSCVITTEFLAADLAEWTRQGSLFASVVAVEGLWGLTKTLEWKGDDWSHDDLAKYRAFEALVKQVGSRESDGSMVLPLLDAALVWAKNLHARLELDSALASRVEGAPCLVQLEEALAVHVELIGGSVAAGNPGDPVQAVANLVRCLSVDLGGVAKESLSETVDGDTLRPGGLSQLVGGYHNLPGRPSSIGSDLLSWQARDGQVTGSSWLGMYLVLYGQPKGIRWRIAEAPPLDGVFRLNCPVSIGLGREDLQLASSLCLRLQELHQRVLSSRRLEILRLSQLVKLSMQQGEFLREWLSELITMMGNEGGSSRGEMVTEALSWSPATSLFVGASGRPGLRVSFQEVGFLVSLHAPILRRDSSTGSFYGVIATGMEVVLANGDRLIW